MKKNRSRLTKLLLLLIFILLFFLLKNELPKYLPAESTRVFADLEKKQIKEIKFTKVRTTRIYKKEDKWFVKKTDLEFKADAEKLEKITAAIINLKKDTIVSTNKNKHQDLGIGSQKIEIVTDKKNLLLYVGNSTGLSNNYVRVAEENEVFITEGLNEVFADDDYRDLKILAVKNVAKVTSIDISHNGNSILLSKKGEVWKIDDETVKQDRVDFYLNDLATLKASDILPKKINYATAPELTIILKENNKNKTITFYQQNKETYLSVIAQDEYDYLVPAAYVASLKKEQRDFIE